MKAWKAMLAASVVLLLFAAVVSVANVPLTGPTVLGTIALVAVGSGLFYVVSRRGFKFGQQLGENMREKE